MKLNQENLLHPFADDCNAASAHPANPSLDHGGLNLSKFPKADEFLQACHIFRTHCQYTDSIL
jgi:hypothetical protein